MGERSRGRQQKTWMNNIREDLKKNDTDFTEIRETIINREVWRSFVRASSSGNLWKRRMKKTS